jgi:hypothetical protein
MVRAFFREIPLIQCYYIANLNELCNGCPSSPCPLLPQEKGEKVKNPVGEGFKERLFAVAQLI